MLHRWLAAKNSVKDKANILNHNNWSGGEYLNQSYLNYASSVSVEVSNEWCTNGHKSFKATTTTPNNVNSGYFYTTIDVNSETNYTFTVDLKNNGETSTVRLFARQGNTTSTQQLFGSVSCPAGEITPITITGTIPKDYNRLILMFPCVNGIVFIDNLQLLQQ